MTMPRIVTTPLATPMGKPAAVKPRRVSADVLAAVLPGPGRDRLASGDVLVLTTGQQPGLFTGPLYTIYKALSAAALARRVEAERNVPVVPVFWVAGDDHDFAEANHVSVLNGTGETARIVLRERAADALLLPLFRERCGPEITTALAQLRAALPETEFSAEVLGWLEAAYRPEANLADAGAEALNGLLAPRGIAVFRAHAAAAKRAAAPWLLRALDVTLPDGLSPVLVEGSAGRDRLRASGGGDAPVTRRSGERFTPDALKRIAAEAPERLSANVLLRPVIEAALFPTVAYAAGPGELEYLPQAAPLYKHLGVTAQTPVPRWSGIILESRVEKVLERYELTPADFAGPAGALEARFARDAVPPEVADTLVRLRAELETNYERLAREIARIDPTLERNVQSARNAALGGTHEVEKKVVASLKRANETLTGQLARARAALAPEGKPQERVLTAATFLARYGLELLDAIEAEVARWAGLP